MFHDEAARAHGNRVLGLLLGSGDAAAMLVGAGRRASRLERGHRARDAAGTGGADAWRRSPPSAKSTLGALLARMPSLGRWSKGSPHADLADILRRRCGAGPIASRTLPRAVRRRLARAGGFGGLGAIGWYVRFMLLRPASSGSAPAARPRLR